MPHSSHSAFGAWLAGHERTPTRAPGGRARSREALDAALRRAGSGEVRNPEREDPDFAVDPTLMDLLHQDQACGRLRAVSHESTDFWVFADVVVATTDGSGWIVRPTVPPDAWRDGRSMMSSAVGEEILENTPEDAFEVRGSLDLFKGLLRDVVTSTARVAPDHRVSVVCHDDGRAQVFHTVGGHPQPLRGEAPALVAAILESFQPKGVSWVYNDRGSIFRLSSYDREPGRLEIPVEVGRIGSATVRAVAEVTRERRRAEAAARLASWMESRDTVGTEDEP